MGGRGRRGRKGGRINKYMYMYLLSHTGLSLQDGPAHFIVPHLQSTGKDGTVRLVPDSQVEGGVC